MDAIVKVVSRSKEYVPRSPEIPQRIEVVIQVMPTRWHGKQSVTKHLRFENDQYVGRQWNPWKRKLERLVLPVDVLGGRVKGLMAA